MLPVESRTYQQASAILESDFNARVAWHARRRLRHLHFQEFCRRVFAQPFLPHEEIRPAQSTLPAERSHIQSATRLLGNQLSPLRPCLLFVWSCRNIAMRHNLSQDGVRLALTIIAATTGKRTNCSPAQARIQVPRCSDTRTFQRPQHNQVLSDRVLGEPAVSKSANPRKALNRMLSIIVIPRHSIVIQESEKSRAILAYSLLVGRCDWRRIARPLN